MRRIKNRNISPDFPEETEEFVSKAERLFEPEGDRLPESDDGAINAFKVQDISDYPEDEVDGCASIVSKQQKTAREYAMYLVSVTSCTEHKLIEKLRKKGVYSSAEIADALEYVKGFGYVNDLRLAQATLPRLAERLWGRTRICYYFKSKGISSDVLDALDFSEIDFVYYCRRLAEKNAGKPFPKLMRTLLNAGYTSDEISEALEGLEVNESKLRNPF